jgi:hypothetical protein
MGVLITKDLWFDLCIVSDESWTGSDRHLSDDPHPYSIGSFTYLGACFCR